MECSIGHFLKEECHQTESSVTEPKANFSEDDLLVLSLRTKCKEVETICTHHYNKYISRYSVFFGRTCCDPLKSHKSPCKKSLRIISLEMYKKHHFLTPGQAICDLCRKRISALNEEQLTSDEEKADVSFKTSEEQISELNKVCELLQTSPVKKMSRYSVERRKQKIENKASIISSKVRRKLDFSFSVPNNLQNVGEEPCQNLSSDYYELIEELREKFDRTTSHEEKLKILTLVPKTWTVSMIQSKFKCSEYMARNAKKARQEYGVLSTIPQTKTENSTDENIEKEIIEFYQTDEVSRVMPGKKDCLVVKTKEGGKKTEQKRLVLFNLKDAFQQFKEKNPTKNIGFSKFASLRPPWCILAGSSGTHNVCICSIHQNLKLMMDASKCKISYKDLLQLMVCDIDSAECMLGHCPNCPGADCIDQKIHLIDSEIKYKQWVSTDRSDLVTILKDNHEFLSDLKEKLVSIKKHHFIAKRQANFLQSKKLALSPSEIIIIGDFSENYTCIVQDAIQSFHWVNSQVTLHPFVVYYKYEDILMNKTFCVISDELSHSTESFYAFQKTLINYLKTTMENLQKVLYFSDGCAAQYKNKKKFANLCYHEDDFKVKAEWNFFATSHGKGPCDGAGGTIKRLVTKASLQRTNNDQILNADDMYNFCKDNISGIHFFFISKKDIENEKLLLNQRFTNLKAVPQTRSYHCFTPTDDKKLKASIFSGSDNFDVHNVFKNKPSN